MGVGDGPNVSPLFLARAANHSYLFFLYIMSLFGVDCPYQQDLKKDNKHFQVSDYVKNHRHSSIMHGQQEGERAG